MILKGSFIIVYLDGTELAYQDSCTVSEQVGEIPVLSTLAGFQSYIPNEHEITISCSGLRGVGNEDELQSFVRNRTILVLEVRFEEIVKTERYEAFITRLVRSSEAEQYATFNAQFRVTNILA